MKETRQRCTSHKIRTPEEIEALEVRRKQKERERNTKARERLKAAEGVAANSSVQAWFDGSCEPVNPGGTARFGIVIKVNAETIHTASGIVGSGPAMSINCAEDGGVIAVLEYLIENQITGYVTILVTRRSSSTSYRAAKYRKACATPILVELSI